MHTVRPRIYSILYCKRKLLKMENKTLQIGAKGTFALKFETISTH